MNNHIVCIASEFKGNEFFEECHDAGWNVTLVTRVKLLDLPWSWTSVNAVKTVPNDADAKDYIRVVTNLAGNQPIDRIVGMDEFDVLTAAKTREHLQLGGMTSSHALRFRDKLAMRNIACEADIPCPEFTAAFNPKEINAFLEKVSAPWIIKPRTEVNAFGMRKCETPEQVWQTLTELDNRHNWRDHPSQYLIEEFIEGKVYHVDSVVENGKVAAAGVSVYGTTPFKVSHHGGVFTTSIVPYQSKERNELEKLNKKLLKAFNMSAALPTPIFTGGNGREVLSFGSGGACRRRTYRQCFRAASGFNLWCDGRALKRRRKRIRIKRRIAQRLRGHCNVSGKKMKNRILLITTMRKSFIA